MTATAWTGSTSTSVADELGHIHLDGSIHLATAPELGAQLVAEGLGRPFPWARGWTMASVSRLDVDAAVAMFRRNYNQLRPANE